MKIFRKNKNREWRKAGHETHEVLLSANDPGAEEFALALRVVKVDVAVLSNVVKWVEETIAIRAITSDEKKYQARIAIVRGSPTGKHALRVAGALAIAFSNNFTPREMKLAVNRAMRDAQESPKPQ